MADLDTKALEAACLAFNSAPGFTWERVEAAVRAYLSALPKPLSDLDTKYMLVPREPNGKMIAAASSRDTTGETNLYASIYRAMIAAAPALPSTSKEVAGMVWKLRGRAAWFGTKDEDTRDRLNEAATLLEALDAELRALKDRL